MNDVEPWLRARARSRSSSPSRARSELGASAVEYGLLIAGIAALIAVVVFALGGGSDGSFKDSCDTIFASNSAGSCD